MRNLFWVFAALAVVFGLASANLWRNLRAERSLAASLQTQLDEAGRAAVPILSTPSPATSPTTVSSGAASVAANQPAAPAAKNPQAANVPDPLVDFQKQQREMMKDPEYRKARLAQIRVSVAGNNRTLAEDLGLSPAEADKLLDLLAEQELGMSTEMMFRADANDQAAVQEMVRKQQESMRQRDEKVAALVGPSRAAQWQQYQQAAPARGRVNAMNNTLIRSNQPLSAAQQRSLATAFATEMHNLNEEMSALTRGVNPQDPLARAQVEQALRNRQEESNQRILAAATPILSAAQLATVRAQFEQQNAMTRAMQRARERASAMQAQGAP
jgi:hypothetical protein